MTENEFETRLIRLCVQARESQIDPAVIVGSLLGSAAAETVRAGKGWSDFADGLREQWDATVGQQAPRGQA